MAQQLKDKQRRSDHQHDRIGKDGGSAPAANPEIIKKGKELKKDTTELLDKIDDVLEENAAEFVKNYIQKGGE